MPNKAYRKGYEKERRVMNKARAKGYLSYRSAGSHSKVDVTIVNKDKRLITFVQCKPDSMSANAKQKLIDEMWFLNGGYKTEFIVK